MGLGLYSGVVSRLPVGWLRDRLEAVVTPAPVPVPVPEDQPRPSYWRDAELTHTMADSRRKDWERVLAPYRPAVTRILEIGSYEGQSALFWLNFFPGCWLTCIDTWEQAAQGVRNAREVERHFDRNVEDRVRKIKGRSTEALHALGDEKFDLIYIDGDHSQEQVLIDTTLAWSLLRPGGIMIWDDYCDAGVKAGVTEFLVRTRPVLLAVLSGEQQLMVQR